MMIGKRRITFVPASVAMMAARRLTIATSQFEAMLVTAVVASASPMILTTGPTTTGGMTFRTFSKPTKEIIIETRA
jgi:hypothetical protein